MPAFSRYNLIRRIGIGGMAEVWKAKAIGPEGFEKTVAIKKVLPDLADSRDFIQMFVGEAKLVADLVHPNIVQVFDFGHVGRADYFLVMEYVAGQDLSAVIARCAARGMPMPRESALYVALECAKALAFAHAKTDAAGRPLGLVHRDLSPGNVLVSYGGEVKITDFGIAKLADTGDRTQAGTVRGNAAYLSPEQALLQPLDQRSDLFTLGAVLFELLTGKRLFAGNNLQDLVEQARNFRFPAAESGALPAATQAVLMGTLRNEPARRFQDAFELEEAIVDALGKGGALEGRRKLTALLQRLFEEERKAELSVEPHEPPASSISLERPGATSGELRPARPASVAFRPASVSFRPAVPPPRGATPEESSGPSPTVIMDVDAAGNPRTGAGNEPTAEAVRPRTPPPPVPRTGSPRAEPSAPTAPTVASTGPARAGSVSRHGIALYAGVAAGFFLLAFAAVGASRYFPGSSRVATMASPLPAGTRTGGAGATRSPAPRGSVTPPTVTPTATPTATRVAVVSTPQKRGALTVYARPWCRVYVDGKKVSDETPLEGYKLPAGKHVLRFENPVMNFRLEKTVVVPVDGNIQLFVDVPAKTARVTKLR